MREELKFTLVKEARSSGGDRYESSDPKMTIYLPQHWTRTQGGGRATQFFWVTFSDEGPKGE